MLPQILPITQPAINWIELAKSAEAVLGYSPAKYDSQRPLSEPARFLALAAMFKNKIDSDAVASLRAARSILDHLNYGFLVAADRETIFELMQCTDLKVSTNAAVTGDVAAIVTGSLAEWRDAIIELSRDNTYSMRVLLDKVFVFFERNGLGELWSGYKKQTLNDKTIILLEKQ